MSELKTGRVEVKPVTTEKNKTEYQLVLDGHVLGQSKLECDALFHAYQIERSLGAGVRPALGRDLTRCEHGTWLGDVCYKCASAYPEAAI